MAAVKGILLQYSHSDMLIPATFSSSPKRLFLFTFSSNHLEKRCSRQDFRPKISAKEATATCKISPNLKRRTVSRKRSTLDLNLKRNLSKSEKFEDLPENTGEDFKAALQCEHFQRCSGCTREWGLDKPLILEEVKNFFDDHDVHDFTFTSEKLWEWRCRAKLAVRGTSETPQIGLYEEGTHNVVDIPSCRAHHPQINSAIGILKEAIKKLNIQPYDEVAGIGDLRYVQMAVSTYDTSLPHVDRYRNGKVQVALVWNSRNENSANAEKLTLLYKFLWTRGGPKSDNHIIHSIWSNFQTSSSNIIFGGRWRHLVGERDFWERFGGVDICMSPGSFAQANTQAFTSMLYKLCKYVKRGSAVVELYAGVGIIGLCLAANRKCRSVKCIEINKESKLPFEKSLARLPESLDSSISWHCADVSKVPIHWLEGSDVIVVDPPRKGLDNSIIDALQIASLRGQGAIQTPRRVEKRPWILRAQKTTNTASKTNFDEIASWPDTLIYVSCGWTSFKQDCQALLSNKAWHIKSAHAFNFFPGTDSIEVLAIFKCGERIKLKKKKSAEKRIARRK
ncbi:hypothetical protein SUGI_1008990 [Cryptomeria japonica]|uniref:uncharacterized protein LOC131079140 isoform X2 n=1 Tax=Cryptomeria japonica TaxID=3369 RepID=UPI0024148EA7|nr:uncharacterized protein LOC131079140 isoform X2 [Cryptomeria japonica]GLJ47770.1 hypothetical protein SUGI_1008990 [Cryptomeria japonica]